MVVIDYKPGADAWDEYITGNRAGLFTHLYGWGEALATTYKLRIFRLAARSQAGCGEIVGVLPLILFAVPNCDKRLISLPYSDCAGLVCENDEIAGSLLTAALKLAAAQGVEHLELRQLGVKRLPSLTQDPMYAALHHIPHSFKVGLSRSLPSAVGELWSQLSAKVRNQIRKARKCGCHARVGGSELHDDFYSVFAENMRDLGSPVHAPELFRQMACELSPRMRVVVVFKNSTPVAAAIIFIHNYIASNPWASSLRSYRPECPNMLLYWTMLSYACESGSLRFDFGRSSPDASTCRFKLQWGAEMEPLVWHVFSRKPSAWNPRNESLEIDWWTKLSLEAAHRHGPPIRRWISL